MARSKSPQPAPVSHDATDATLATSAALHGELVTREEARLASIDDRFGLDGPYDRSALIATARSSMQTAAEHMLVIGRACILLKEHEPHGSFGAALREIGIADRSARVAMQVAMKFDGDSSKKLLAGRLSASKLLELVTVDDTELDLLAEGGTVANLTLDEIDTMSQRELREALRRERKAAAEELESRDQIIARKDEKIRQLDVKARGLKRKPANERALVLLGELDAAVVALLEQGDVVKAAIDSITAIYAETGNVMDDAIETRLRQAAESAAGLASGIEHLANG